MERDEFLQVIRSPFHFATCDAVLRGCKIVDISKPLQWRRLSKKVRSPLGLSARGLRPQAVGERTVRLPEIFRAMAKFSPSAPSGHRPRRWRSACQKTSTLLYRECRGDHWSPASLAQQRAFRDGFLTRHTGTGEQCSPLQEFFDRLTSLAEGGFISSKGM